MAKGLKTGGGSRKGIPNRATAAKAAEIAATGETPLEYMTRVYRDESVDKERRDRMASAAAPYIHPKLQAINHSGDLNVTVEIRRLADRSTG